MSENVSFSCSLLKMKLGEYFISKEKKKLYSKKIICFQDLKKEGKYRKLLHRLFTVFRLFPLHICHLKCSDVHELTRDSHHELSLCFMIMALILTLFNNKSYLCYLKYNPSHHYFCLFHHYCHCNPFTSLAYVDLCEHKHIKEVAVCILWR